MSKTYPGSPAVIYCDGGGGHASHQFAGGWGVHVRYPDGSVLERCGGSIPTTNNKMELTAAIRAVALHPSGSHLEIYCDSQYVVFGITQWIYGWHKRGWVSADEKPVKNKALWELLYRLASKRHVNWHWVKGHNGNEGNERADVLATEGRTRVMRKHGIECKTKTSSNS